MDRPRGASDFANRPKSAGWKVAAWSGVVLWLALMLRDRVGRLMIVPSGSFPLRAHQPGPGLLAGGGAESLTSNSPDAGDTGADRCSVRTRMDVARQKRLANLSKCTRTINDSVAVDGHTKISGIERPAPSDARFLALDGRSQPGHLPSGITSRSTHWAGTRRVQPHNTDPPQHYGAASADRCRQYGLPAAPPQPPRACGHRRRRRHPCRRPRIGGGYLLIAAAAAVSPRQGEARAPDSVSPAVSGSVAPAAHNATVVDFSLFTTRRQRRRAATHSVSDDGYSDVATGMPIVVHDQRGVIVGSTALNGDRGRLQR